MKIGILGCGYDCVNDLDKRLAPWFEAAKESNIIFSFVSCMFKEYKDININTDNSKTIQYFQKLKDDGLIQFFNTSETALIESDARNLALFPLLQEKVDCVWLLDLSDEYYSLKEIKAIISYISNDKFNQWYGINFKNYILDGKQWIDDFCPPRIFFNSRGLNLVKFYWDNDMVYTNGRDELNYKYLVNQKIPKFYAHVRHMTWLHSNGKAKIEYQNKHFGHCSYKWNNETNRLEIDKSFFIKNNLPQPIIHIDND
jgi:hypothetical protein